MHRRHLLRFAVAGLAGLGGIKLTGSAVPASAASRSTATEGFSLIPAEFMEGLNAGFERTYAWHSGQADDARLVATAGAYDTRDLAAHFAFLTAINLVAFPGFVPFEVPPDPLASPIPNDIDHNTFAFGNADIAPERSEVALLYRTGPIVVIATGQGSGAGALTAITMIEQALSWPLHTLGMRSAPATITDLDHLLPRPETLPPGFTTGDPDRHYPA